MSEPFFTIGHSTRAIDGFIAKLAANGVACLVDVRTVPRSRTNPQFNKEALPGALAKAGIAYRHMPALGGLRPRSKDVPPETNGFWENQSFHNYADYAMGGEFRAGIEELRDLGEERRCAVMCAEAVWWQCHRRIITDYLLASGEAVFHILESDVPERATITPQARGGPGRTLVYPGRQAGLGLDPGP
jgi:uncharacterized protein (DUF488 family)